MNMDESDAREATAASPPAGRESPPRQAAASDEAFVIFYRGFFPELAVFLRWQGVPLPEAVDLAQETMVEAYRLWNTIDHPAAWARRVASRKWAQRIARIAEEPVADIPERLSLLAVTGIAAWEQRHYVLWILDQLPPRQRQVLAWTLCGYTPTETANELRMKPEAVRASLAKARRTVASYLRATGGQR
jgi:RNA polymerase sigma factor (sigma-70 family)